MKKSLILLALITGAALNLKAQTPSNDDCANAINLGIAPACDTTVIYSNDNATLSVIGDENNPTCFNGGIPSRDVWFTFVCPASPLDFRLTLTGEGLNGIVNPQFAVYRGGCDFNDLFELDCVKADLGETSVFLDVMGLTPGITYYIRVSDYSLTATPNSGDFTFCVGEIPPITPITNGGSTQCSGTLVDSGGENGDYGPNEDYVFTICPDQQVACITFVLDYYNIEYSEIFDADALIFYNGNSTNAPVLAELSAFSSVTFDNETGGAVCYKVQGTSPCMTVQFISDNSVQEEGFLGHWECSNMPCPASASITVNNPISNQTIVNAVTTPATQVTITNIDCENSAYGSFSYPTVNNDLQMTKGLVLSSGSVDDIANPGQFFASSAFFSAGDNDLDILSAQQGGETSNDACVVEMDVFVATDQLSFEYVFGSEEYPEYVFDPGGFNDIFAFLVSGPNITGDPGLGNKKNIAVLPGTSTPVEINSVNNQVNWEFYRNNLNGSEIVYDGLTSDYLGVKKTLTARTSVTPCETYHLKLAIADRGDASFDSGVFISEIKGGAPDMAVQFASGIDYFIEGCSGTEDVLLISLTEPLTQPASFFTTIGGTAILGVDYQLVIPPVITFEPGQTQLSFPIFPLTDALVEGTETITITLSNNFGCGTVIVKTLTINLEDNVVVQVNGGEDTLLVCQGTTLQLNAEGAQEYFWTPASAVSNPAIPNPTITPTQDQTLIVTGSLGLCVSSDTVFIKIVDPSIDLSAQADTLICLGTGVPLLAANNSNNTGLTWSPTTGLSDPGVNNPIASPTSTTTYTASINVSGCVVSDQVTIKVDTLFFPTLTTTDTTVCQNYPVILGSEVLESTTYQWTPATGLSSTTISNPVALPAQTTTYTLVATSANGYCDQTATVKVNVISANIAIAGPDYMEICLGTTVPLQANATPAGGAAVTWSPAFYAAPPTGPTTTITADESVTIVAQYIVNGCQVFDSVRIRVDSLPDLSLRLQPAKPIYCPGDTVTLLSTTYEPASFPDIMHQWLPDGLGQLTPDSLWNLVIRTQETDTFYRITMNRACLDTVSIIVPVDSIPVITVTASKTSICPGESSQLTATVVPDQALKWDPPTGLSCVDCPNPVAFPMGTTQFTVTTPDANCPASSSITIEVLPAPVLALPVNPVVCPGDDLTLNNAPAEPNTTYSWTSTPPGFTSPEAQPVIIPAESGNYNVTATNTACSSTGTVSVTVPFATLTPGGNKTICQGQSTTITATADGTPGSFSWTTSNGSEILNGASQTVSPTITTIYTVTYTYSAALCMLEDNLTVVVNPAPNILGLTTVPEDGKVCEGAPVTIKSAVFGGSLPLTYNWTQDGQAILPGAVDSISLKLNGDKEPVIYLIGLTVTDATGCSSTQEVPVEVKLCFDIPNAFSPNGDAANDSFGLVPYDGVTTKITRFVIYNRWGQKVFTSSPSAQKWDGNVDGKAAPVDVYIYQIEVERADGTTESFSGEVTLIR